MDAYHCLEAGIDAKIVSDSTGMGNIWLVGSQDDSKLPTAIQHMRDALGEAIR